MAITQIKGSNIEDGTVLAADIKDDSITNAKIKSDAAIAQSKLVDIVDADIAANAAIGATKLASTLDLSNKTVTLPTTAVTMVTDTTPQLGGELDGQGNVISDVVIKDYAITTVAKGSLGATPAWDFSAGQHQTGTVSENITSMTWTNEVASDEYMGMVISLTNGAAYTIVWTDVNWAGGTAPTLTASGLDLLHFYTYDGGTTIHGVVLSTDSK